MQDEIVCENNVIVGNEAVLGYYRHRISAPKTKTHKSEWGSRRLELGVEIEKTRRSDRAKKRNKRMCR